MSYLLFLQCHYGWPWTLGNGIIWASVCSPANSHQGDQHILPMPGLVAFKVPSAVGSFSTGCPKSSLLLLWLWNMKTQTRYGACLIVRSWQISWSSPKDYCLYSSELARSITVLVTAQKHSELLTLLMGRVNRKATSLCHYCWCYLSNWTTNIIAVPLLEGQPVASCFMQCGDGLNCYTFCCCWYAFLFTAPLCFLLPAFAMALE